ncbi:hypothetical protein SAMN05421734_103327 [Pelagirhabdus alkalitolerans]|uniref:CNNM transmembrane domain-containing protein n=1 Tax=Pelagirhabdus alkalitolerans TaxID=1612202 RepID=A0A1G6I1Y3_9BACI|nr:hypothetical protein [Pelagirhabdus alkalitolerans]SDC00552.1 hypothetical protein SAMN05421734_103327 [Pelagirhabdus alkalitolerans]
MAKPRSQFNKALKFSISIAVITLVLAAIFSVISSSILSGVHWFLGIIIVFLIVFLGVFFDTLGVAATAAVEKPFHAMASEKVYGAKEAVLIVRNADRFASFCNDVVGDISGVISGTASALVVLQLAQVLGAGDGSFIQITVNVIMTSIVAALTVGGKAMGKYLGIYHTTSIIIVVGKAIALIERHTKIKVFSKNKK